MLAPKLLYNLLTTPGNVVESQAKGKTDELERCKERRDEVRDREASQVCGLLPAPKLSSRRTTMAADIRFWFPERALTSYGYMVLPQTNTVTDAYISTGMCAYVAACVRACLCTCTPLWKMKPFCNWWSRGLNLGSGSHRHTCADAHTHAMLSVKPGSPSLSGLLVVGIAEHFFSFQGIL